jgi:hypothetical protein
MKKLTGAVSAVGILALLPGCTPSPVLREHYVCDGALWRDADGRANINRDARFSFKIERYTKNGGEYAYNVKSVLLRNEFWLSDGFGAFFYFSNQNGKNVKIEVNDIGLIVSDDYKKFGFHSLTQVVSWASGTGADREHFEGKCRQVPVSGIFR